MDFDSGWICDFIVLLALPPAARTRHLDSTERHAAGKSSWIREAMLIVPIIDGLQERMADKCVNFSLLIGAD